MAAETKPGNGSVPRHHDCDVLVIGTGAAGLTAAVTARKAGLDVVIAEKEALIGGTSATSGGVLWVPGNPCSTEVKKGVPVEEAIASARRYVSSEGGNYVDQRRLDTYFEKSIEMVRFLEAETEVEFYGMDYPDYYSENPDAGLYRSIGTVDYQASKLGPLRKYLKNQLPQMLFLGLAIGSSVEMKEFMRAGRSIKSMGFVIRRLAVHFFDVLRYGQDEQAVRGRALVARLTRTAQDLDIPIWLSSPVVELLQSEGRVSGALLYSPQGPVTVHARRGVISACGGYPGDPVRKATTFPRLGSGPAHGTVTPPGNTGDGIRLAERVGAAFTADVQEIAPWMPVSVRPGKEGFENTWPHLVERQKAGFIAVTRKGQRFVDESASYHHFVPALLKACAGEDEAVSWLIADKRAVDRWGIGFVRPFPVPRRGYIRSGYLLEARTLDELAQKAGIDSVALAATITRFNANASLGVDPDFNRGNRTYDLYQGDDEVGPNPCLAPIERGPFYAVKVVPGEIGTFAGLRTDEHARVLDGDRNPIPGLYAAGNDQANVFGGTYPGPGATLGPALTFAFVAARHISGAAE